MNKEGNKINGVKIYDYIYEITEGVLKALEKKYNIQITDKKFTKELRDLLVLFSIEKTSILQKQHSVKLSINYNSIKQNLTYYWLCVIIIL